LSKLGTSVPIIRFDSIQVNSIDTNSGIFIGTNLTYGWTSHNKSNTNISGISGDFNSVSENINVLYDNDGVDTAILDKDYHIS